MFAVHTSNCHGQNCRRRAIYGLGIDTLIANILVLSNLGVHYVKLVDKAITIDNLRLLCLVVNVCRGAARRSWYKYSITARWKFCRRFINSRLNAQYFPSYGLDRKSYVSFRLASKSVTLNDLNEKWPLFCVILPNLVVSGAHCVKVVNLHEIW